MKNQYIGKTISLLEEENCEMGSQPGLSQQHH